MVVVLARLVSGDRTELLVAPITHSLPPPGEGVAIPERVKRQLGLDDDPSWVIVTELNRFTWPGPDIRLAKGQNTPLHGALPLQLFDQVRQGISSQAKSARLKIPKRTNPLVQFIKAQPLGLIH